MLLSAQEAPAWLNERARTQWAAAPRTPQPGEVWLLSWDGAPRALALVTVVHHGFVLAMPVTDDLAGPREAVLPAAAIGRELTIWPRLETGLGNFLLHRNLGSVVSDDGVRDLRGWGMGVTERGSAVVGMDASDVEAQNRVLSNFAELCFIEWPGPDDVVLNVSSISEGARAFSERTEIPVARVLQLWDQEPLTNEERDLIPAALGRDPHEIFVLPDGDLINDLAQPPFKDLLVRLADARNIDEASARRLARSNYALAARTDSATVRETSRLRDTLLRLLAEDADGSSGGR